MVYKKQGKWGCWLKKPAQDNMGNFKVYFFLLITAAPPRTALTPSKSKTGLPVANIL